MDKLAFVWALDPLGWPEIKRTHDIYSSDPPNEWVSRISELTKNYCLSSSFKEDDKCINAMFEIFDDLFLINFHDWKRSRLKTNLSRKHSIDEKSPDR